MRVVTGDRTERTSIVQVIVHTVPAFGWHALDDGYAETFWTPALGPSALLMWKRLVQRPGLVDVIELGRELGLSADRARRTLVRLEQFAFGWREPTRNGEPDRFFVHERCRPLGRLAVASLPERLRVLHERTD